MGSCEEIASGRAALRDMNKCPWHALTSKDPWLANEAETPYPLVYGISCAYVPAVNPSDWR